MACADTPCNHGDATCCQKIPFSLLHTTTGKNAGRQENTRDILSMINLSQYLSEGTPQYGSKKKRRKRGKQDKEAV
jgi:hypothetical protein